MSAIEPSFGLPDFEASGESEVAHALSQLQLRQTATLELFDQEIKNPALVPDLPSLVDTAAESESEGFEAFVTAYMADDLSDLGKHRGIVSQLEAAKQRRVEFLSPLVPEVKLVAHPDRQSLIEKLLISSETDEIIEETDNEEDEAVQFTINEAQWEIVSAYKDELLLDIAIIREALDQENDEEDALRLTRSIGRCLLDVSKIAAGVYLGNTVFRHMNRYRTL